MSALFIKAFSWNVLDITFTAVCSSNDEAESSKAQWARDLLWEFLGEDGLGEIFEMR